jgi:predicted ATPase
VLPAPQARALQAVLARRDAPSADRFAIGAAVLSLLAAGSERNSTLVVVDDGQWLDASSADALLFAARRMRREGVAVLVATRPGGAFDSERTGLPRLTIGGLDPRSARTLLAAIHGELPSEVISTVVDGTHGNPLALVEVPRLLSDAQLAGEEPIDEPLPPGARLERALLGQVSDLPASTRQGLLVAAASGTERLQPVLDALGVLGLGAGALDAAEETSVLVIAGERFGFRHPLLRSAIYHAAPSPARRAAHAALARATSGEAQAWHLAQATVGEDETVAARVETVALEARGRGALAAAAAALERAARLSEDRDARVRRLTEAARDAYVSGRADSAMRMLDRAVEESLGDVQPPDVEHVRGRILMFQGRAHAAFQGLCERLS